MYEKFDYLNFGVVELIPDLDAFWNPGVAELGKVFKPVAQLCLLPSPLQLLQWACALPLPDPSAILPVHVPAPACGAQLSSDASPSPWSNQPAQRILSTANG